MARRNDTAEQRATIGGVVTDSSSAVVPGAAIRLVNSETGEGYSATSCEAGGYAIPFKATGDYQDVNAANFGAITTLIGGNQARIMQMGLRYSF